MCVGGLGWGQSLEAASLFHFLLDGSVQRVVSWGTNVPLEPAVSALDRALSLVTRNLEKIQEPGHGGVECLHELACCHHYYPFTTTGTLAQKPSLQDFSGFSAPSCIRRSSLITHDHLCQNTSTLQGQP